MGKFFFVSALISMLFGIISGKLPEEALSNDYVRLGTLELL